MSTFLMLVRVAFAQDPSAEAIPLAEPAGFAVPSVLEESLEVGAPANPASAGAATAPLRDRLCLMSDVEGGCVVVGGVGPGDWSVAFAAPVYGHVYAPDGSAVFLVEGDRIVRLDMADGRRTPACGGKLPGGGRVHALLGADVLLFGPTGAGTGEWDPSRVEGDVYACDVRDGRIAKVGFAQRLLLSEGRGAVALVREGEVQFVDAPAALAGIDEPKARAGRTVNAPTARGAISPNGTEVVFARSAGQRPDGSTVGPVLWWSVSASGAVTSPVPVDRTSLVSLDVRWTAHDGAVVTWADCDACSMLPWPETTVRAPAAASPVAPPTPATGPTLSVRRVAGRPQLFAEQDGQLWQASNLAYGIPTVASPEPGMYACGDPLPNLAYASSPDGARVVLLASDGTCNTMDGEELVAGRYHALSLEPGQTNADPLEALPGLSVGVSAADGTLLPHVNVAWSPSGRIALVEGQYLVAFTEQGVKGADLGRPGWGWR